MNRFTLLPARELHLFLLSSVPAPRDRYTSSNGRTTLRVIRGTDETSRAEYQLETRRGSFRRLRKVFPKGTRRDAGDGVHGNRRRAECSRP